MRIITGKIVVFITVSITHCSMHLQGDDSPVGPLKLQLPDLAQASSKERVTVLLDGEDSKTDDVQEQQQQQQADADSADADGKQACYVPQHCI